MSSKARLPKAHSDSLHEEVHVDVVFSILEDLTKAVEGGRKRATADFCNKLCVTHKVSRNELLSIIGDFNECHADYFGDGGICDDELEDKLLARLETGCSMAEQEGRYNPWAKGPLEVVKPDAEKSLRDNRTTLRVKKRRLVPRGNH